MVDELKQIPAQLTKPRTIFTFMFFATFLYGTAVGAIEPSYLVGIVTTLMGFWFGSRNKKDGNGSK